MISLCPKIEGLNAATENHSDHEPNHEEILENGEFYIPISSLQSKMMINAKFELYNDSMISLSEADTVTTFRLLELFSRTNLSCRFRWLCEWRFAAKW